MEIPLIGSIFGRKKYNPKESSIKMYEIYNYLDKNKNELYKEGIIEKVFDGKKYKKDIITKEASSDFNAYMRTLEKYIEASEQTLLDNIFEKALDLNPKDKIKKDKLDRFLIKITKYKERCGYSLTLDQKHKLAMKLLD